MGDDVVVIERWMRGVDEVLVSGPGDAPVDVDLTGDQVDLQQPGEAVIVQLKMLADGVIW